MKFRELARAILREITTKCLIGCASFRRRNRDDEFNEGPLREETLSAIVDAAPDAVIVTNRRGEIVFANPQAVELFGYSHDELVGQSVEIIIPESFRGGHAGHSEDFLGNPGSQRVGDLREVNARRKNGSEVPVEIGLSPVKIDGTMHVVAIIRDATGPRRVADRLRTLALHDTLTGLPNRECFQNRLSAAITAAKTGGYSLAVLFLDLDGFKNVNDTFGHHVGDALLKTVGNRISTNVRAKDQVSRTLSSSQMDNTRSVSRIGGDEFTVLLSKISEPLDAEIVARRILDGFTKPIQIDDRSLFANASIGIAIYPVDGIDSAELLRNSDAALYSAKGSGRGTYRFYSADLNASAKRRHEIAYGLRRSLRENRLSLHYQPVRNATTGELTGAEALLRWDDTELGSVAPSEFIPIAEEAGIISSLGNWVLQATVDQMCSWRASGFQLVPISINVSPLELQVPDYVDGIREALDVGDISPGLLELEIAESVILHEEAIVTAGLNKLNEIGIRLVLDDFGTGFSSLSHLATLPIGRVKIDRSFVSGVPTDTRRMAIISGLSGIARQLGMRVSAEGVETAEQASFLRDQGCDDLQGTLLGKPVVPENFVRFMNRAKDRSPDNEVVASA